MSYFIEPEKAEDKTPLVLVIDDEPVSRNLAASLIEQMGYTVALAENGKQGFERATELMPDIILTDALMPGMDGREMCRRLKANPDTAGIRIIVTTGLYTKSKYRTEAINEFQVDEYLTKPLDPVRLRTVIDELLARKQ
jgi:CheY-like chemotaxis protein